MSDRLRFEELIQEYKEIQNKIKENDNVLQEWINKKTEEKDMLNDKLTNKLDFIKNEIVGIAEQLGWKETKTQQKFDGISGSITRKKAIEKLKNPQLKIDNTNRLAYSIQFGQEYIKEKNSYSFDWAGFKSNLQIIDSKVVNTDTGEYVEFIEIEKTEEEIIIK